MKSTTLFHRNFTIMVVGQIMSLFGNSILRFALSLYVLDLTGSATIFGGILALSMIPTVLLSPLGGVLADRKPRQRIMVVLDFSTAALIAIFAVVLRLGGGLPAIAGVMMILSVIQALYQPSVQASIPSLTAEENLMAANGVVVQVQALAGLLGPILAGFLYALLSLPVILVASGICFFASAVMELFLRIPYTKPAQSAAPLKQIGMDLKEAFTFLRRDTPQLLGLLFIIAGLNFFLSALFTVGLPYLIKIHLALSAQLYGFSEAALGFGSILGGLLSTAVGRWIGLQKSYLFLLVTAVCLLPIALTLALDAPALVSYGIILVSVTAGLASATLFNVAAHTFVQQTTPTALLGKVASFTSAICVCAIPLGQSMYGILLEVFRTHVWVVILLGVTASFLLALATGRVLGRLSPQKNETLECTE